MKIQKIVGLTLGLMLFVSLVYADVLPSCGAKWPSQTIQFSNISSLKKFELHLLFKDFSNTIRNEIIITKDTAYFMPGHGGAPSTLSFFALSNTKSTDTIEINNNDEEIDFNFSGIENNKLQFSKESKSGLNKLLLVLSLSAIVGLFILVRAENRKTLRNNSNPSA